jgi:hypothetical protein
MALSFFAPRLNNLDATVQAVFDVVEINENTNVTFAPENGLTTKVFMEFIDRVCC